MLQKQKGMTLISWVAVIAIAGLIAIATLRLVPVYLEYFKVSSTLDGLKNEFTGKEFSLRDLRRALGKRFDIEGINVIEIKDVHIERDGNLYRVRAVYPHQTPFIANISFVVAFDKSVEIGI